MIRKLMRLLILGVFLAVGILGCQIDNQTEESEDGSSSDRPIVHTHSHTHVYPVDPEGENMDDDDDDEPPRPVDDDDDDNPPRPDNPLGPEGVDDDDDDDVPPTPVVVDDDDDDGPPTPVDDDPPPPDFVMWDNTRWDDFTQKEKAIADPLLQAGVRVKYVNDANDLRLRVRKEPDFLLDNGEANEDNIIGRMENGDTGTITEKVPVLNDDLVWFEVQWDADIKGDCEVNDDGVCIGWSAAFDKPGNVLLTRID